MTKGIKSILIATLLFAGMNVFVKLLSHLPVFELTLFRSIFTLIICYFLIKRKGKGEITTNVAWQNRSGDFSDL